MRSFISSAPPLRQTFPTTFVIKKFPSLTVEAVDALQTLFRAPLTPGVHPGGRNIAYDLALVKLGPIPNLVRIGPTASPFTGFRQTDRQTT